MKKYVPKTAEEAAYIAAYDPTKYYPNPAVTVDLAVYAFDENARAMKLLLIRRGGFPYKGDMALPGGFLNKDENLETAVGRELLEETGITGMDAFLHCVLSEPERDPRQRVITPEYIALTNVRDVTAHAGDDAASAGWYEVARFEENKTRQDDAIKTHYIMQLKGQDNVIELAADETVDYSQKQPVRAFNVTHDGDMAFDHAEAVLKSFIALRERLLHSDMVCGALGSRFSKNAFEDVLRAAFIAPDEVKNDMLYEENGELTVFPPYNAK